jgi:hypothetical protein
VNFWKYLEKDIEVISMSRFWGKTVKVGKTKNEIFFLFFNDMSQTFHGELLLGSYNIFGIVEASSEVLLSYSCAHICAQVQLSSYCIKLDYYKYVNHFLFTPKDGLYLRNH